MNNGLIYRPRPLTFEHSHLYGHLPQASNSLLPAYLQTNLFAYWRMNEATGNRVNAVTPGTCDLAPQAAIVSAAGLIGNGVSGFGTAGSDFLSCSHNASLNPTQDFSCQCWFKLNTSFSPTNSLFMKASAAGLYDIYTEITNSTQSLVGWNDGAGGAFNYFTGAGFTIGAWTHWVLTHQDATKTTILYVNGAQYGSTWVAVNPTTTASHPFRIGSQSNIFTENSHVIDECAWWTGRVLSASDVLALYNNGNGLTY